MIKWKTQAGDACSKCTPQEEENPLLDQLFRQNAKYHPRAGANPNHAGNEVNRFEDFQDHRLVLKSI